MYLVARRGASSKHVRDASLGRLSRSVSRARAHERRCRSFGSSQSLSQARTVRPVAGRSRAVQQFETPTVGKQTSPKMEAQIMSKAADAARAEADLAAEKVKGGFFKRNKNGITHALWSFVMLGLGAQVVSMTYRKNDAEKLNGELKNELEALRDHVNPYGVWFRQICDEAQLSSAQKKSLAKAFESLNVVDVNGGQGGAVLSGVKMGAKLSQDIQVAPQDPSATAQTKKRMF